MSGARIAWSGGGSYCSRRRIGKTSRPQMAYDAAISGIVHSSRFLTTIGATISAPRKANPPNKVIVAKTSVDVENWPARTRANNRTNAIRPIELSTRRITRYTASGTKKINTRFSCARMCWFTYVENPNKNPPTIAGQNLCVSRIHTRYAAHAASAGARIIKTFTVNRPPNAAVIGSNSSAGPGRVVTQARCTPLGAQTLSVNSGSTPLVSAWCIQLNDQSYRLVSGRQEPTQRWPRSPITGSAKTRIELPRYNRNAKRPRMRGPRARNQPGTRLSPPVRSPSAISEGASGSEIALLAPIMAAQDTCGAVRNPR